VVDDISHEGLRRVLREEGVSFQRVKTWKQSNDPDFARKQQRVLELYAIADGHASALPGDPPVVICVDEFGPLNLQPHPGRQWALEGGGAQRPRRRRRATYTRPHGVRHLLAAYDLGRDRLYGHIKQRKGRVEFLTFLRYLRSLYPPGVRLAIVLDNFSPHLSTKCDTRVGDYAAQNNIELAYLPFYASWLNRIEAQFTALRYFCLDGTDHQSHEAQAFLIRRYIAWRNRNAQNKAVRELVKRANVA
jgi:transposase